METSTQARPHHRELTKTESAIAIAQIYDRASKCIKAVEMMDKWFDKRARESDDGKTDDEQDRECEELSEKQWQFVSVTLDIPQDEMIEIQSMYDEHMRKDYLPALKKIIPWWVNGQMTMEECDHVRAYMDCMDEIDYGYVFFGEPMGSYETFNRERRDRINSEFDEIGSRSKNKHRGDSAASVIGWSLQVDAE